MRPPLDHRLRRAGKDAALCEYPCAQHSFDDETTEALALASALSPGSCALEERHGRITDPDTGREAGIDAPCVTRGESIGFQPEAQRQAIGDVVKFLKEVFQLP